MAFERIKTTHEIRMRLLNELNIKYQEYYLCPMGMDWMTGVYDNESGIFLTQIYKIPDGLSHAGDCYEYAVLLDDGRCFRVTANGDNKPFFKLPPKFTNLTDLILSATIAYGYNSETYRFRLTLDQSEVNRITEEMNSRAKNLFFCSIFHEKLDPRSGVIQDIQAEINEYWHTAFDVVWKGGIHFVVVESPHRQNFGHYYVMRDKQCISPTYTFTKTDDSLFRLMQSVIDDIESGKYNSKKTLTEKVRAFTDQKGLVSYMNSTKWKELFGALNEKLRDIEIQYKSVFDETDPDMYWHFYSDEELQYINPVQIEWLKIRQEVTDYKHIGRLVPPEIQIHDKKDVITDILEKYSIPYEYCEYEQVFIIYGYK